MNSHIQQLVQLSDPRDHWCQDSACLRTAIHFTDGGVCWPCLCGQISSLPHVHLSCQCKMSLLSLNPSGRTSTVTMSRTAQTPLSLMTDCVLHQRQYIKFNIEYICVQQFGYTATAVCNPGGSCCTAENIVSRLSATLSCLCLISKPFKAVECVRGAIMIALRASSQHITTWENNCVET